jgi:hypothetical protein
MLQLSSFLVLFLGCQARCPSNVTNVLYCPAAIFLFACVVLSINPMTGYCLIPRSMITSSCLQSVKHGLTMTGSFTRLAKVFVHTIARIMLERTSSPQLPRHDFYTTHLS